MMKRFSLFLLFTVLCFGCQDIPHNRKGIYCIDYGRYQDKAWYGPYTTKGYEYYILWPTYLDSIDPDNPDNLQAKERKTDSIIENYGVLWFRRVPSEPDAPYARY